MNTDPIADLFTRIRNAQAVGLSEVRVPYSEMKMRLARLIADNGFLVGAEKEGNRTSKRLRLILAYREGQPVIHEFTRVSKPGRRIYVTAKEIKPFKRGHGISIISTSKGLMIDREARQQNLGGELIGKIW